MAVEERVAAQSDTGGATAPPDIRLEEVTKRFDTSSNTDQQAVSVQPGAARTELARQVNVIGSAIFFIAVLIMLANVAFQWRSQPKGAV